MSDVRRVCLIGKYRLIDVGTSPGCLRDDDSALLPWTEYERLTAELAARDTVIERFCLAVDHIGSSVYDWQRVLKETARKWHLTGGIGVGVDAMTCPDCEGNPKTECDTCNNRRWVLGVSDE